MRLHEILNEMDSQGYRGHRGDEDPGKGPEKVVKPAKVKDVAKDAEKELEKAMDKAYKKDVKEAKMSAAVRFQRAMDRERAKTDAYYRAGEEVMARARAEQDKKKEQEKKK
jgi:hypothetical protein